MACSADPFIKKTTLRIQNFSVKNLIMHSTQLHLYNWPNRIKMHLGKFKVFLLTLLQITDLTFAILFPSPYGFSKVSSDLKIKYNVLASKILRPNTIYQVVTSLADDSESCLFKVSISRNGMSVCSNELVLHSSQADKLMLKIPSGRINTLSLLKYYFPLEILAFQGAIRESTYWRSKDTYCPTKARKMDWPLTMNFYYNFPVNFCPSL